MAVTNSLHANSTGVNVHIPYAFEYADETEREAATGMVPADVGKFARQLDDNSIWMLTDDSPVAWVAVGGAGGGVTDAEYLTAAAHGSLSAEVVIPGLAGSPDRASVGGAGFSDEFDSSTIGYTWDSPPTAEDADTTVPSHWYINSTVTTEIAGTKAFSPAGAFEAICKLSIGVIQKLDTTTGTVIFAVENSDNSSAIRMQAAVGSGASTDLIRILAVTRAASSNTVRATLIYRPNTCYFKLKRDGSNNVSLFYSTDGLGWSLLYTGSLTFTVAKIGIRVQSSTGQTVEAFVDYIRSNV
jgi:hypothetical protein